MPETEVLDDLKLLTQIIRRVDKLSPPSKTWLRGLLNNEDLRDA